MNYIIAAAVIWALTSFVLFVTTYSLFGAVIKFKELRDSGEMAQRPWYVKVVRYLILYTGLAADCLLNVWFLTVVYWEFPKEWLCTSRVQRWIYGAGYRQRLSVWFAEEWLNPIEAGHINGVKNG